MFEECADQILEFRGQGGRKHMNILNRIKFLELVDFIETIGPY